MKKFDAWDLGVLEKLISKYWITICVVDNLKADDGTLLIEKMCQIDSLVGMLRYLFSLEAITRT